MENIEKKVADAILQNSDKLVLEGKEYPVCSATPATLIMISEVVSELPVVMDRQSDNILMEVLSKAKDLKLIGRIAAVLILGAKRIKENRKIIISEYRHWSWKKFRYVTTSKEVSELDYVSDIILDNVSSALLLKIVGKRLSLMQIGDFFELTTSLSEVNLLRRTKEVVQTASGR